MSFALDALSPVDGRYHRVTQELRPILSEGGLIRERIRIEAAWLLHLHQERAHLPKVVALRGLGVPEVVLAAARGLLTPSAEAAAQVKTIEQRTNHDVKAVEYFVRERLQAAGAGAATLELVHLGCTSEDINNLAYALQLSAARQHLRNAALAPLSEALRLFASEHAALAMLARTHGQTASPTTLGKEFANVLARLQRAERRLMQVVILGKWNGAVGNYNAHLLIDPHADWPAIAARFVRSLGLEFNSMTTQIEPHDWIGEYCDALAAINTILIDFARNVWGYVSLGYLRQRAIPGEVGSSTMPHKVNPIDFENAEGNLGIANALLQHFAAKLPISRWQRDLTDSTVLRNLGVALAHSLVAYRALLKGLDKVQPDAARMTADLAAAPEVLAEAIQTALRVAGVPQGYEKLKEFSRGRAIDAAALREFTASLPLDAATREALIAMRPADYVGLATALARVKN
jgi:adenylosuccinate lyase